MQTQKPGNRITSTRLADAWHVWLSLLVFLACLTCNAFYYDDAYEPWPASSALLIGWIGHPSWYANLTYVLALIRHRQNAWSAALALTSIALALTFLLQDTIVVHEGGTRERVSGYGLGYVLWITSFSILLAGQIVKTMESGRKRAFAYVAYSACVVGGFMLWLWHDRWDALGRYALLSQRSAVFEELCSGISEKIVGNPGRVDGILVSTIDREYYGIEDYRYSGSRWGTMRFSEYVVFVANQTTGSEPPYQKYEPDGWPVSEEWWTVDASHEVRARSLTDALPERLNISAFEVTVMSRSTDEFRAITSFVVNHAEHRICTPYPAERFSVSDFVRRALELRSQGPTP